MLSSAKLNNAGMSSAIIPKRDFSKTKDTQQCQSRHKRSDAQKNQNTNGKVRAGCAPARINKSDKINRQSDNWS